MKLGVIGCGTRILEVISQIKKQEPSCHIAAVADIPDRKREIMQKLEVEGDAGARYYDTADDMLAEGGLNGVLIGTRCSLHSEMAIKVLEQNLPFFLEKPVSITLEDLLRLKKARDQSRSQVVVSFPLRLTTIVQTIKEIVDSGKIGMVEHVQAVNNVPYGIVYYKNWYRDDKETGGLFLQKATHDFDYIQYVLGLKPVEVCAMTSKQIFKGNKPAGLKCSDCEENRTCPESTIHADGRKRNWELCCFADDTGNEDSGSALVRYASGMHVSYSQNFFARNGAASRGARFLGYRGTIDFDFYTGVINVYMHHTSRVETYTFDQGEDHFGGDAALARNFVNVISGTESSLSTLDDGLLSALICLKAKQSAETGVFQKIEFVEDLSI